MRPSNFTLVALSAFAFDLHATSIAVRDTIRTDTVWSTDTVHVTGNLTVARGVTLTIEKGTEVIFQSRYRMIVDGILIARGTASDSIDFKSASTANGWRGMVIATTGGTSILEFCQVKNVRVAAPDESAISITNSGVSVEISNSTIANNLVSPPIEGGDPYGVGLRISRARVIVRNCLIANNVTWLGRGGGVFLSEGRFVELIGNTFTGNSAALGGGIYFGAGADSTVFRNNILHHNSAGSGGGVGIGQRSAPTLVNNLIYRNTAGNGGGISCFTSRPRLVNNTIAMNQADTTNGGGAGFGGGIFMADSCSPVVVNTWLLANSATSGGSNYHAQDGSTPSFIYSLPDGLDTSCVSSAGADDYRPRNCSEVVDVGTPDTAGLGLPALDLAGEARIFGTRVDIGAYEYQQGTSINPPFRKDPSTAEISIATFPWALAVTFGKSGSYRIQVSDVLGKRVFSTTVTGPGTFEVPGLGSGIRFVRVASREETLVRKLVMED